MHTNLYTHNTWETHYYRLSTTHTHTHSQREKLVHTERHKQRQTCRLIQLRVSSIIQHSAHRHRLKDGIKHARGPHLEITRTLPVFKMRCWEVKIDLGWLSLLRFFKYTNKNCPAFCFFLLTNHGFVDPSDISQNQMIEERRGDKTTVARLFQPPYYCVPHIKSAIYSWRNENSNVISMYPALYRRNDYRGKQSLFCKKSRMMRV